MKLQKAKEVLSENALDLSQAGMDYMPMRTVEIETFEIMNKPNDEETTWYEKAYLIGLVDSNKKEHSRQSSPEGDLLCMSFMVKVHHTYYYREFFNTAMEVIQALRVVNEYKNPYPDDRVTVEF